MSIFDSLFKKYPVLNAGIDKPDPNPNEQINYHPQGLSPSETTENIPLEPSPTISDDFTEGLDQVFQPFRKLGDLAIYPFNPDAAKTLIAQHDQSIQADEADISHTGVAGHVVNIGTQLGAMIAMGLSTDAISGLGARAATEAAGKILGASGDTLADSSIVAPGVVKKGTTKALLLTRKYLNQEGLANTLVYNGLRDVPYSVGSGISVDKNQHLNFSVPSALGNYLFAKMPTMGIKAFKTLRGGMLVAKNSTHGEYIKEALDEVGGDDETRATENPLDIKGNDQEIEGSASTPGSEISVSSSPESELTKEQIEKLEEKIKNVNNPKSTYSEDENPYALQLTEETKHEMKDMWKLGDDNVTKRNMLRASIHRHGIMLNGERVKINAVRNRKLVTAFIKGSKQFAKDRGKRQLYYSKEMQKEFERLEQSKSPKDKSLLQKANDADRSLFQGVPFGDTKAKAEHSVAIYEEGKSYRTFNYAAWFRYSESGADGSELNVLGDTRIGRLMRQAFNESQGTHSLVEMEGFHAQVKDSMDHIMDEDEVNAVYADRDNGFEAAKMAEKDRNNEKVVNEMLEHHEIPKSRSLDSKLYNAMSHKQIDEYLTCLLSA